MVRKVSAEQKKVFKSGRKKINLAVQRDLMRMDLLGNAYDPSSGAYVRLPVPTSGRGGKVRGWKSIEHEIGLRAAKNLREARATDATVARFIESSPTGRVVMDMSTMTDEDWYDLLSALHGRSRASEVRSENARARARAPGPKRKVHSTFAPRRGSRS